MKGAAAASVALVPSLSPANQPKVHDVEIRSFAFHPEVIRVHIGDTIRWTNRDIAPPTATADEFGWDTESLDKNEAGEIPVRAGMEVSYFCVFHPHMKGGIEIISG
ncbi:MAG: copper-binding protein [Rhodobacteraceae bacterium]|nr:copper-binding protein [Paracoccaceae bacterium]